MGASVTSTVRGKIFNSSDYEDQPEIVLLGMFTSLVSASFMMMVATYLSMPVSTTHTIIGCIIGFASAANGIQSVNWDEAKNIFISWVAAPLLTGLAAFCIYGFIRHFILMSENSFERGYYSFSFVLFAAIGVNLVSKSTCHSIQIEEKKFNTIFCYVFLHSSSSSIKERKILKTFKRMCTMIAGWFQQALELAY